MILLFTDFSYEGPYVGQMHAVLAAQAPGVPVIDLMHDAPAHDPRAAAYLLAALAAEIPEGAVCVAVVDPGVGSARPPVVLEAGGRTYVGPGNGLFEQVQRQSGAAQLSRIDWRPPRLSDSFHGRDLFAPVAAMLARGDAAALEPYEDGWRDDPARPGADWPDDLPEIVYVDGFGNLVTGLRAAAVPAEAVLTLGRDTIRYARVFAEAPSDTLFWYVNSMGLIEIALANGSAARRLNAVPGTAITVSA